MRIVSQDKMNDYPYDKVEISVDTFLDKNFKQIYAIYATMVGTDLGDSIGTYGTKERALEVMEEIRTSYVMSENFKLSTENDRDDFVAIMSKSKCINGWDALKMFTYFEMPKE